MKQNTYIKIVDLGIQNPVEGLLPFKAGCRFIPLPDGTDVEIRNGVLMQENIVIFRCDNEVVNVIHTPHNVFIQEGKTTIGAYFPHTPLLMGVTEDKQVITEAIKDNPLQLPAEFYDVASDDLKNLAGIVVDVLNALPDNVVATIDQFDRIAVNCPGDVGLEDGWLILFNAIEERYNLQITPICVDQMEGIEFICFGL